MCVRATSLFSSRFCHSPARHIRYPDPSSLLSPFNLDLHPSLHLSLFYSTVHKCATGMSSPNTPEYFLFVDGLCGKFLELEMKTGWTRTPLFVSHYRHRTETTEQESDNPITLSHTVCVDRSHTTKVPGVSVSTATRTTFIKVIFII